MMDNNMPTGDPLGEDGLSLEQVAAVCRVEGSWLVARLELGVIAPDSARPTTGEWRLHDASIARVRRMRQIERDFDAEPELAALVADLLEEMDRLRARLRAAGLA
jgi:chaperone modulatory protein CbpM